MWCCHTSGQTSTTSSLPYRLTCLTVVGQGVLLRAGALQDLLALAVQDDQVGEAGLLDVQRAEQLAEHAACVRHQPLQRHTPHHLHCIDKASYTNNNIGSCE